MDAATQRVAVDVQRRGRAPRPSAAPCWWCKRTCCWFGWFGVWCWCCRGRRCVLLLCCVLCGLLRDRRASFMAGPCRAARACRGERCGRSSDLRHSCIVIQTWSESQKGDCRTHMRGYLNGRAPEKARARRLERGQKPTYRGKII